MGMMDAIDRMLSKAVGVEPMNGPERPIQVNKGYSPGFFQTTLRIKPAEEIQLAEIERAKVGILNAVNNGNYSHFELARKKAIELSLSAVVREFVAHLLHDHAQKLPLLKQLLPEASHDPDIFCKLLTNLTPHTFAVMTGKEIATPKPTVNIAAPAA